jgi:hypothetical protein
LPRALALAGLAVFAQLACAETFSLQGNFVQDDDVKFITLTLSSAGMLDVTSLGYAGGQAASGQAVPAGGFDTMLFLYSASGTLLAQSDDGINVPTDPLTGLASDAAFSMALPAGTYKLALTQYDNFALGNLSSGFSEAGAGNFTPTLSGNCTATAFCDWTGAARTSHWALDVSGVSAVPELPPAAMLVGGLTAVAWLRRRAPRKV